MNITIRIQTLIFIILGVLVFCGGVASVLLTKESSPDVPTEYDFTQEKKRLSGMFNSDGSKKTYDYFKTTYQSFPMEQVHNLAHWVGNEIYLREGLEGIALCDQAYNWGCYHGLLGKAISDKGMKILVQVEEACQGKDKNPLQLGGCLHGIGHGVLSMEGYAETDLIAALKDCDLLREKSSKVGCYNGTYMEYNTRTMQGLTGENVIIRQLGTDPHEPCSKLPSTYQPDCYFEQPSWWTQVMPSQFDTFSQYCSEIENEQPRDYCYRGIGRAAMITYHYSKEQLVNSCKIIPYESGVSSCINEGLQLLLSQNVSGAIEVCDALADRDACRANAQNYSCGALGICSRSIDTSSKL
jgi:hypothetical protein